MKSIITSLIALVAVSLTLVACGKKSSVDTSAFQSAFKSAEPALQTAADKAVSLVKSADYSGAVAQLQSLAKETQLTDEQQQAIKNLLAQVQQAITDAATKAAGDAGKAAGDLQKTLKP